MKKAIICFFFAIFFISGISNAYTVHDPIHIEGDNQFTKVNGVAGGSGTEIDPYIISGWEINRTGDSYYIIIQNTTKYFIIKDCYIHGKEDSFWGNTGIALDKGTNAKIENVKIEYAGTGIKNYGAIESIKNPIISNCEEGIYNKGIESVIESITNPEISNCENMGTGIENEGTIKSIKNPIISNCEEGIGVTMPLSAIISLSVIGGFIESIENAIISSGGEGIGNNEGTIKSIKNSTISNGRGGIGNGGIVESIENVAISNCKDYGILNHGTIKAITNTEISNSKEGIYNKGIYNDASKSVIEAITNTEISNCETGIYNEDNGSVIESITNSTISKCQEYGIYLNYYGIIKNIENSIITSCGSGIYTEYYSTIESIRKCNIERNNSGLFNNSNYAKDTIILNAIGNWWGSPDGPSGTGPGNGDMIAGKVQYKPWATSRIKDAGATGNVGAKSLTTGGIGSSL